jgi:hypothetical protein
MKKSKAEKALDARATRVASVATGGNPVSVLKLADVHKFARAELAMGRSDAEAILNTVTFIRCGLK